MFEDIFSNRLILFMKARLMSDCQLFVPAVVEHDIIFSSQNGILCELLALKFVCYFFK